MAWGCVSIGGTFYIHAKYIASLILDNVHCCIIIIINTINNVFPGEFNRPFDVAVCPDTGRVMVADLGNSRIQILDTKLKHTKNITHDGDGKVLSQPAGICINNKGDIIISDWGSNRVLVYDKTGLYKRDMPGTWCRPCGITVDSNDFIYVCDQDTHSVKVIDKDGNTITTFGGEGTTARTFHDKPRCITVHNNQLLVSDDEGCVYHFTQSGVFIKNFESGIVKKARGLTVSPAGDLIIVDQQGEVVVVSDGRAVCRVGETGGESWHLEKPQGVAVTSTGQVVVANHGKHNLLLYDMVKKTYAN